MFNSLHVTLCPKHFREICRDVELDQILQKMRIARLRLETWQKALRGGLSEYGPKAEGALSGVDSLECKLYAYVRSWLKVPALGALPS